MEYRELAAKLRSAINRGEYPPDTTLPRQIHLAEQFGINVGTVRRAIQMLAEEGLVTPVRAAGDCRTRASAAAPLRSAAVREERVEVV